MRRGHYFSFVFERPKVFATWGILAVWSGRVRSKGGRGISWLCSLGKLRQDVFNKPLLKCRGQNKLTSLQKHRDLRGNIPLFSAPHPPASLIPSKEATWSWDWPGEACHFTSWGKGYSIRHELLGLQW